MTVNMIEVDVTEFRPPHGERIERQAYCPAELGPLVEALQERGFSFSYEVLGIGQEVLYVTHAEGDYRILFLKPEHKNAAGAMTAVLSDVTIEDADAWLKEQTDARQGNG